MKLSPQPYEKTVCTVGIVLVAAAAFGCGSTAGIACAVALVIYGPAGVAAVAAGC